MALTISSVLTMCILNSVLIAAMYLILKMDKVMNKIGPKCAILIFMAIIIRMFIPFEFSYTHSLWIEDALSPIRRFLIYKIIEEPIEITIWNLLTFIWGIGIIYLLIKKLIEYKRMMRYLSLLKVESWEALRKKYCYTYNNANIQEKVKVVLSNQFESPYLMGLKQSYLVLPNKEYDENVFKYIVLHELMHVRNKDIVWKVLIDILCIFFWWNPLLYYLKREMFRLIEMRNDMQILSNLTEEEKVEYLKCLKVTATELVGREMFFGVSFSKGNLKELDRRMKLIINEKKVNRGVQYILCMLTLAFLIGSSAIIIEPYSLERAGNEGVPLTSDNTFLVVNGENYDVYVNGEYVTTMSDLQPFEGVNIYNTLEEALKNE